MKEYPGAPLTVDVVLQHTDALLVQGHHPGQVSGLWSRVDHHLGVESLPREAGVLLVVADRNWKCKSDISVTQSRAGQGELLQIWSHWHERKKTRKTRCKKNRFVRTCQSYNLVFDTEQKEVCSCTVTVVFTSFIYMHTETRSETRLSTLVTQ